MHKEIRTMMKQRLKVAFLLLALASLAACNSDVKPKLIGDLKNAEKAERIIPVRTLVAEPASNIITNSYAGVVEESLSMDLSFKYGGTLERLMVKEGSRVKKGTPIAVVSSATAINAQRTAKATLDQAQDAYERLKLVYDSGSLPEVKSQEMLANLEKAKATADLADDMVKECTLIAPVDGLVTEINAEVGANVSPLFPIMKLISTDAVFVRISVPEKEISKINLGDEASIQLPALNDSVFPAKVLEKGVVANLLSHAYSVKLGLDNSQGVLLIRKKTSLFRVMLC